MMNKMWRVSNISFLALFLFSLTSLSQGRIILETPSDSVDDLVVPFVPLHSDVLGKDKAPKPVAWLEGLCVQDGQISPVFNSSTLNYTVTLSPGVTNIQIFAQVSLGTDHEKYKVKTKSFLQPPNANLSPLLNGNTSVTLVEVHVSAEDHQSVTYYLEVGHALQDGRSEIWSVLLQILFWTGVVVAVAMVGIFGYSVYLALSEGGVTGEGLQGYVSRAEGEYEAVQEPEIVGNSRS